MSWGKVKIRDCCKVVSGATPKRWVPEFWGGDIKWVTPKDISKLKGKYIHDTPESITALGYKNCSASLLPVGAVLLSSRAPIGLLSICASPMCTNQGFKSLIPGKEIDSVYLYYCLLWLKDSIIEKGTGSTFKEVSKAIVEEIEIPLPPLEEQKRIAEVLDKADRLRQQDRQLLQKYDQLLQSVFLDMFGDPVKNEKEWEKVALGDLIEIPKGLVSPLEFPYCDLIHVGGDNIEKNTGKLFDLKQAKVLNLKSGKFYFDSSYILYNKIRPYLNKVAKPEFEGICSADMYPIKPLPHRITKEFLFEVLRSKDFLSYAETCSRRANIPKINKEELSAYETILPSYETQLTFSKAVSTIDKQKKVVESMIELSESLFQSLLQKAFKGELELKDAKAVDEVSVKPKFIISSIL